MNNETLKTICAELDSALNGRRFGKLFQLSALRFAIDLRLPDQNYLLISAEPGSSRIHLAHRRSRDIEKQSVSQGAFALSLRRRLTGATVESLEKLPDERVLKLSLRTTSELGEDERFSLVAQLTGRSSNIFLLDAKGAILDRLRATAGDGQEVGDNFRPPLRDGGNVTEKRDPFTLQSGESLSEAIDRFHIEKDADEAFASRARSARQKLAQEIAKRTKLLTKLEGDLDMHGDADRWKRFGDLLLANIADAKREGAIVSVKDYFDESTPVVQIEVDENDSITEAAESYFKRYTKARNAKERVAERMSALNLEIDDLRVRQSRLEEAIAEGDASAFEEFEAGKPATKKDKRRVPMGVPGARRFVSSDGLEILVGKGSKDNDHLTFRVAKSGDLWLHAADYPGSHVVVRNPNRTDVPQKTLLQAAQLAAFYSDARHQLKAAVNYTQKKFVNKPRGAAPGLVSLSGFKTILVEPMVPAEISQE